MTSQHTHKESANVGTLERLACTLAGGLLVTGGLRKPSPVRLLGAAAGADLLYRGLTGHCAIYGALGVNTAASHKSGADIAPSAPEIRRSVTIGRSTEELYRFAHDPHNLAQIVGHFAEVTPLPDGLLHWRMRGPLRNVFEWDTRIEEQTNQSLSWETLPGSAIVSRGSMTFKPAPDSKGSEVSLFMKFEPPLGAFGAGIANWLHKVPRAVAGQTLRRFKSLVETGEIPSLGSNPSGRGSSDSF